MTESLKLYKVKINGIDHIFQLSAEDAKRYGKNAVAYNGKAPAPGAASPEAPAEGESPEADKK